jgi:hypothetical protein
MPNPRQVASEGKRSPSSKSALHKGFSIYFANSQIWQISGTGKGLMEPCVWRVVSRMLAVNALAWYHTWQIEKGGTRGTINGCLRRPELAQRAV